MTTDKVMKRFYYASVVASLLIQAASLAALIVGLLFLRSK